MQLITGLFLQSKFESTISRIMDLPQIDLDKVVNQQKKKKKREREREREEQNTEGTICYIFLPITSV